MVRRFQIDPYAFLTASAALLLLPLDWLLSAITAAVFHELCHILAISLTGHSIQGLSVKSFGASISVPEMKKGSELICAAAGPIGSVSLLLLGPWLPKIAICGFVQGVFNLVPVYPLDGGRILCCVLPESVYRIVQQAIFAGAIFAGVYLSKYSLLPLFVLSLIALRLFARNIPCKEGKMRVQ